MYRYTILANNHTRAIVFNRAVGNAVLIPQDIIRILQGFILKLLALAIDTEAAAIRILYDVEVLRQDSGLFERLGKFCITRDIQ